ncbi:hypothetical protein L810_3103 [Burkholderia sp. AU4i]|nr:hypothetical protein L810_3103 [Burkholderia sp. AU4i]
MRTRVKRRPAGNPSPGRRIFRVWRAGVENVCVGVRVSCADLNACVSPCEFPSRIRPTVATHRQIAQPPQRGPVPRRGTGTLRHSADRLSPA